MTKELLPFIVGIPLYGLFYLPLLVKCLMTRSKFIYEYKKDTQNFWQRNKDQIIVQMIIVVATAAITLVLQQFISKYI